MAAIGGAMAPRTFDTAVLLGNMVRRLSHHPDSEAEEWLHDRGGLCHVRTLTDRSAAQPVFNRTGRLCLVMAGECYGYREHRRELEAKRYVFGRGHADAEYCLALYEELGAAGFARLNGSFCLAICDLEKGELVLVSDRMGSRPLFHGTAADGTFVFATQVSAVLCHSGVSRRLDEAAVLQFCALQRVIGSRTYHAGVAMLAPASVLRFSHGETSVSPYWQLKYEPLPGSKEDYADELAATIAKAAERITEGGVRAGVLLSGGLDSRMLVAATRQPLVCFTFGDYENPESEVAKRVAEARGYPYRFLQRAADQYAEMVDPGVEIGSGMHPFNHAHALGFLDAIRRDCDVLTHGYGIEILFRGTSLPRTVHRILGIELGKPLDTTLTDASLQDRIFQRGYNLLGRGMRELFAPAARDVLDDVLRAAATEVLRSADGKVANVFDRYLWPDVYFRGRFPSFLFELALRPFVIERSIDFDNDILELHQRMPVEVRADPLVWVHAMARLDRDIAGIVSANTGRSPMASSASTMMAESSRAVGGMVRRFLGPRRGGAGEAGKSPRSWPRFDWMIRNNAPLRAMITQTVADPAALPPAIFDLKRIGALLDEHLSGRANHRDLLFALLTLGRWHGKYAAG